LVEELDQVLVERIKNLLNNKLKELKEKVEEFKLDIGGRLIKEMQKIF
jgi:hypothetical protein